MHGTYKLINIQGKEVCIDACLFNEIEELNRNDITTKGCCCRHGEGNPVVLVDEKNIRQMLDLNYGYSRLIEYEGENISGVHEFYLKTGCRTFNEVKNWHFEHTGEIVFKGFREGYTILGETNLS